MEQIDRISRLDDKDWSKLKSTINPPIKYPTYLLRIASDCSIILGCQEKKILENYQ